MSRIVKNSVGYIVLLALITPLPVIGQDEPSLDSPKNEERLTGDMETFGELTPPPIFDADSFIVDRNPEVSFKVARVISGNTLLLENGEMVRLLGVEIPEDLGVEAYRLLRGLLEGKEIKLGFERRNRNLQGQLLAYVFKDGVSVNNLLKEKASFYSEIDPTFSYTPTLLDQIFPKKGASMDSWEIIFGEAKPLVMKAKVVLKNRQTLRGELLNETPEYIILKIRFSGNEIIEKKNIAQLSFE
jgi:hypothetical protein